MELRGSARHGVAGPAADSASRQAAPASSFDDLEDDLQF
jgi:hypothetical protein